MKTKSAKKISIYLFFVFIYLFFAGNFKFRFSTTRYNYFNYLAEAFLHGKLHFVSRPPQLLDLSVYKQKIFLYFPPAPTIAFLPFVCLFGKNFSDIFISAFIGGSSCFVFYLFLLELKKSKLLNLKIDKKTITLLTLIFAFGSNHFYLSCFGAVWWTAHVFAAFYLNLSLYFLFKFINRANNIYIALSAIFFCLAFLSRFSMIFAIVFITAVLIKSNAWKNMKVQNIFFYCLIPSLTLISLFMAYNYFRFQSPFQLGYKYQIYSKILQFNAERYGRLNLIYLPFNLYYFLLHPYKFFKYFPFYRPYHNGNSIFLTLPTTLMILSCWKRGIKNLKKNACFAFSLVASIILILLPALLNFSPGGPQIGYRYSLNFLPFLLVFLLFFVDNFKSKASLVLLILSLYFGLTSFYIFKHNLLQY